MLTEIMYVKETARDHLTLEWYQYNSHDSKSVMMIYIYIYIPHIDKDILSANVYQFIYKFRKKSDVHIFITYYTYRYPH